MKRLAEKIAVITGGASGIGGKLTQMFVDEGATVIAADINEDGLQKIEEYSSKVKGIKLDVSSEKDWQHLVETVEK